MPVLTPVPFPPARQRRGYGYRINPIDCWDGWTPLVTAIRTSTWRTDEFWRRLLVDALNSWQSSGSDLIRLYNDPDSGDGGPWVMDLPGPSGERTETILALKQEQSGVTFVFSYVPLPWLNELVI